MTYYNTIAIIFFLTIVLTFVCAEVVLMCCIIRYTACYSKVRKQRIPHRLHLSTKQKQSETVTPKELRRESERTRPSYHHVTGCRNINTLESTRNAQLDDCNSPVHHKGSEDRADDTTATNRHNTTSLPHNAASVQNVTEMQTRGESYRRQKAETRQIKVEIHEQEHSYETINTRDSESHVYAAVTESMSQSHSQHGCLVHKHQSTSHQQQDHVIMRDDDNVLLATRFYKTQSQSEKDDEHESDDSNAPPQQDDYTYVNNSARYTCSSKQGESALSERKESSSQTNREPTEILTTTNVAYLHVDSRSPQVKAEATSMDDSTCRYDHMINNGNDCDNQGYYEDCSSGESQLLNEKQKDKTDKHTTSTSHVQPGSSVSLTGTTVTTYDKWGRLYSDC